MGKINCHVISNTHWDREWRYPFQSYRIDLVEMMDRLLDILEKKSEYRAFLLDSQTVIIEDYLEIRPENEKRIKKLVRADRIQIGPWWTLPDQWSCPGEALVRNLLMGQRVGKRFGSVLKVGYTPFSNGQISQLPQLYQGFNIDSCFFYRGVGKHIAKSEFIWESPDGSRVFAFRFGDYARYNYYYLVYRPCLLGRFAKDRDYIWNPDEIPYHIASEQSQDRQYGWMNQKIKIYEENVKKALEDVRKFTESDATTSHFLYIMGHDHSFPVEEEVDLIKVCQKYINPEEEVLFHSALDDYMELFRRESKDLKVLGGEMRHTNKEGLWTNLMAHILSSRLYLKQQNARINTKVLYEAEPLSVCVWLACGEYPAPFLEVAWKKLLINQTHDAVGGCSVDRVHKEMEARWGEVDTISDEICRRSMRDIVFRIDFSSINKKNLQLTVFNTLPYTRSGVGEFIIDIPTDNQSAKFSVETLAGKSVPIQIILQQKYTPTIEGGYELPMPFTVQRFKTKLYLEDLPPMGYKCFVIKQGKMPHLPGDSIIKSDKELENEFLKVKVNNNGTLKLTDKRTGRVMDNLCYFEDTEEFGDPWNRKVLKDSKPIYSLDRKARVSVYQEGHIEGILKVCLTMMIPAGKTADEKRSSELTELPITLLVGLKKNSPVLDVTVNLDNTAKDHRLRILFPSGIYKAESSFAEGQFDVLKRPIKLPQSEGWKEPPYSTHPMWNFVDVSDGEIGFAIINDGLTEYEVVDDRARTIAITLLRTFGKFVFERPTPDSQCLGEHCYRFALFPHTGFWYDTDIFKRTAEHITSPQALESAPTKGTLPPQFSFLSLSPNSIVFSGIKQGEDKKSLVIRFWNPLEEEQKVNIKTAFPLKRATLLTLEEKKIRKLKVVDGKLVSLKAGKKKIMTVGLMF